MASVERLGGIAVSPAIRRILAGMDRPSPTLADIPTGDTRPVKTVAKKPVSGRFFNRHGPGSRKKEEKYLAQRRLRGLGDALLGGADLANMVINAGIADFNLLTGGLGSKRDVELSMPSQDAANFLTDITGTKIIPDEEVSPEVRQEGANQRAYMGMIPTGAEDVIPSGAAVQGILHGVPNLFKKPALEDLAKGVDPDKVWHDWQWEMNAAGQPWTETTGKPTLNPTMERRPLIGGALPPRVSDFEPPKPVDPSQAELFREHEMSPDLPTPTSAARVQLPMKRGPFEPRSVTGLGRQPPGLMRDFVENPQLYEQPGLEFLGGIPTQWTDRSLPRNPGASGLYYPPSEYEPGAPKGRIEVRSDQPHVTEKYPPIKVIDKGNPQPVATAQHELTHAAAQEFGLPQGYSWLEKGAAEQGAKIRELVQGDAQKFADAFDARTADYYEYSNDLYDRTGQTISLAKFNADWAKAHPELGKILAENRDAAELLEKSDPQLAYRTSMGEVSARNAAKRDTELLPKALRMQRPAKTEDVPRKYQWTQEEEPGQIVKPSASVKDPEAPRPVGGLGSVKSKASNTEIPVASKVDTSAPQGLGIRAYHGSPHSFEEFDISKIGTGEGAQAYGHGLYFAEHEPVAASYRESLAGPSSIDELKIGNRRVGEKNGFDYSPRGNSTYENIQSSLIEDLLVDELALTADPAKAQQIALAKLKEKIEDYRTEWPEAVSVAERLHADLSKPGAVSLKMGERPGHMYEVDIAADPDAFLDWDRPLSEQSEKVRNALGFSPMSKEQLHDEAERLFQQHGPFPQMPPEVQARIGQLQDMLDKVPTDVSGADYYRGATDDLGSLMSQMHAAPQGEQSKALLEKGIPGIKYFDQGSRATSGGELLGVEKTPQGWQAKIKVTNRQGVGIAGGPTDMFTTSKPYTTEAEARKWAEDKISSGSRNYVVFDPKLISIVRKYGLAAAIASGVITEEMGRQMQEQGAI